MEASRLLGAGRVRPGDAVVAMASSGLHSNGYSLVRHVLLDAAGGAGWSLDRDVPELGRTLGEELLEPTRIYAKACLDLAARHGGSGVHAMSHVTGGGLAANLARVLPPELTATIDRSTWTPAPVFDLVRRVGAVPQPDLEMTLNCGVGMVALVAPDDADRGRPGARRARRAGLGRGRGHGGSGRRSRRVVLVGRIPAGDAFGRRRNLGPVCGNSLAPGSVVPTTETDQTGEPARRASPGQVCEGVDPMGRGRAKAKQTKVARDLKYRTHETDFGALAKELHGDEVDGDASRTTARPRAVVRLRRASARLIVPCLGPGTSTEVFDWCARSRQPWLSADWPTFVTSVTLGCSAHR